jgi:hypothetical protein
MNSADLNSAELAEVARRCKAERRKLAGSTTATTYHQRAKADLQLEDQGRWTKSATVTGATRVRQYPAASRPWNDPVQVPQEPPLGYAINDLETTGEAHEVAASLLGHGDEAASAPSALSLSPGSGDAHEATGISFPSVANAVDDLAVDGAGPTHVASLGVSGVLLRGRRL